MGQDHRLTRDDVAHVAELARLHLDEEELEMFTDQLAGVLDHAADIAALELEGVEPTAHAMALANVFRPDEARPVADREEILSEAPDVEDHCFRVPPVLGEAP